MIHRFIRKSNKYKQNSLESITLKIRYIIFIALINFLFLWLEKYYLTFKIRYYALLPKKEKMIRK